MAVSLVQPVYQLLSRLMRRVADIPKRGLPMLWMEPTPFDEEWGTETSKVVWLTNPFSDNYAHGIRYQGCRPDTCRWAIEVTGAKLESFNFVDIGCGKGRALLIASKYPFRKLIGVEYSRRLLKNAQKNLIRHVISERYDLICEDATKFKFADENTFAFFYNPFDDMVLSRVLENLQAISSEIYVAWVGEGGALLPSVPWLMEIGRREGVRVYRRKQKRDQTDAIADDGEPRTESRAERRKRI